MAGVGVFEASGTGPSVAAVQATSGYGSAILAGNMSDDPTVPDQPVGVYGESLGPGGVGVRAKGTVGVWAEDFLVSAIGVLAGRDMLNHQLAGVYGESSQQGVYGLGRGDTGTGVYGLGSFGVRGETGVGVGVRGVCQGAGTGVWGESQSPSGTAGHFVGDVVVDGRMKVVDLEVSGDVLLTNRDLAERFPADSSVRTEPGTLMVLTDRGTVAPSAGPYDPRVVGIVSGAGELRPAITLGADVDGAASVPIAMTGTAFCLVDAESSPVRVGDLLTTSPTAGHAMRAVDPQRAFGAVVGKALGGLCAGRGLVPVLVGLR
jgi:hypothetical protein